VVPGVPELAVAAFVTPTDVARVPPELVPELVPDEFADGAFAG
jgi:hypothetical protein